MGNYTKYFETETDYQSYKSAGRNLLIPSFAVSHAQMMVHYNWDDDHIYDPDEVVLTRTSNPVIFGILYDDNEFEYTGADGYTVSDLAALTLNVIYSKTVNFSVDVNASIFTGYNYVNGEDYDPDDDTIETWSFDEFKYFTGLTSVPDNFFRGCTGLTSITLPHTITSVGYYAFHDCYKLTTINLLSHPTFDPASMTYTGSTNNTIASCNIHCSSKIFRYYKNNGNVVDINDTKILWSDKTVYTLSQIKSSTPSTGYPIGVNITGDKYVSLKYMNMTTPDTGSTTADYIVFGNQNSSENNITYHNDISTDPGIYSPMKIQSDYIFYATPIDSQDIVETSYKYFNGKIQTQLVLGNISNTNYQTGTITSSDDYPAAECVWRFNPGDTAQGDWYIPEIGELVQIYMSAPIISYICSLLNSQGFNNIYTSIDNITYWSSTFYGSGYVYYVNMYGDYLDDLSKNDFNGVLAMLEL